MNPFSTAPLFASLTVNFTPERRKQQAFMACVYAFGILVTFLIMGRVIVEFFSISVPGIRVAGGLIISTVGFGMLFPARQPTGPDAAASEQDVACSPIAMPSLAGPGSIAVVLGAAAQIQSRFPDRVLLIFAAVVVGMVATLVIAFVVLRAAGEMVRFLGPRGIDAMTRIFGFLLICIGMQFLLTGIADFFQLPRA
jgi:multiple antibiotic resistance protein